MIKVPNKYLWKTQEKFMRNVRKIQEILRGIYDIFSIWDCRFITEINKTTKEKEKKDVTLC